LLDAGNSVYIHSLLNDDLALSKEVIKSLERGHSQMRSLFHTIKALQAVQRTLQMPKVNSITELTLRGVAGDLRGSSIVEDILVSVKKLDSEGLSTLLTTLRGCDITLASMEQHEEDLVNLVTLQGSSGQLRSKYDDQNSTIKTTIVKHRVNLSKAKKQLSERDAMYTELVERFHEDLEEYLTQNLLSPRELFLNEVFLFDLRNPLKDTFAPKTRFSIERALSTPFDYLISTSEKVEDNLSARQPETAILYQLYLESGSLVNVFDLWKAFYTILGREEGESCDERSALMLFYRALSELKALGMLRTSRKKIDHVSKSAWKGL
jgi:origin recognition complex subunit 3